MEYIDQSKFSFKLFTLLTGLVSLTLPVLASETEVDPEVLPDYVVVSTRTSLPLDRVSPSVCYISAGVMEFWQDRRVIDALKRETGVALRSNGAPGSATSLFLRGTESNHTGFFLDGRRLNPTTSGQYDLESLFLNNLGSVQLQKGSSSVNYGSHGIGGVVDLRTEDTFGYVDEGVFLEGEIGSNDYYRTGASAFVARDDWGLSLGAATLTTDNERDNDDFENRSVTARFDYLLAEHLTFELLGNYSESEKGVPGNITAPTSLDEGDTESWLISPGLKYAPEDLTIHLFYSRSESERDDYSTGQFGADSNAKVNTDELNLQVDYKLTDGVLFTFGGLYRNDEIESARAPLSGAFASAYDDRYKQAGAFAQVLYRLTDDLELRGGIRYDDFSAYDDVWTGNIEAIYTIDSYDLSFFAKLSESFAPPTLLDVAYNPSSVIVNAEESVSYEVGLRQNLYNDSFEWTLVFFRNEIEEFIAYDFDTFTTYNIGEVTTEGVELSVDYSLTEKVGLGLGYTYLTAENDKTGDRLVRRPRHALQLSANYFITDNLSVGAVGIGYFDSKEVGNVDHGDSFVVNLVANCDINDTWSIFARAENVLDREYESVGGYPSLGRTGYIGARMKF